MKLQDELFDVIVVGGGAAGMMAAGTAAKHGKKVLILEKNRRLGEKLRITGGGRCNVTNAEFDIHKFLAHYGPAADFLYSPFAQFGVQSTFDFFAALKLPLVVQARNRAFPRTEKAADVERVMEKFLKETGVFVKENCPVKKIITEGGAVNIEKKSAVAEGAGKMQIVAVETNQGIFRAKAFILATGGVSHPETGSTGDGFAWLRDLGHTVKNPTPTIVPLEVEDAWVKMLAGTSLSFMKITFSREIENTDGTVTRKKAFSETGKILFTHFGLSGPLILNAAGKVNDLLTSGPVVATIDAYPDTDLGSLDRTITATFDKHKNKDLKNIFKEICPEGTADAIATLLSFDITKKVHSVTKDERKEIARLLKALPVRIRGLMGFDRAVVADGGVPLTEIDMKTMRSNKISNLYLTGDLLHVNRPSGGYSLQLCWTTGFVAGAATS